MGFLTKQRQKEVSAGLPVTVSACHSGVVPSLDSVHAPSPTGRRARRPRSHLSGSLFSGFSPRRAGCACATWYAHWWAAQGGHGRSARPACTRLHWSRFTHPPTHLSPTSRGTSHLHGHTPSTSHADRTWAPCLAHPPPLTLRHCCLSPAAAAAALPKRPSSRRCPPRRRARNRRARRRRAPTRPHREAW